MISVFDNDLPQGFFQNIKSLAVDTESMGLNLSRDRLCLVQISDSNQNVALVKFNKNYFAPNLISILEDKKIEKIFHFARFDMAILQKYLGTEIKNVFCTKIASKLARTYTESHGLKELCRELLGVQISKQQQSSYWGTENLSNDQKDYAAKDVIYLHRIRDILHDMLIREERMDIAESLFRFLPTRVKLDLMGWDDIFSHS